MPPTTYEIRDTINYHHVREDSPLEWVDTPWGARTPAPGVEKARLLIRRSDGALQKWISAPGAIYHFAGAGLFIRGKIRTPTPAI